MSGEEVPDRTNTMPVPKSILTVAGRRTRRICFSIFFAHSGQLIPLTDTLHSVGAGGGEGRADGEVVWSVKKTRVTVPLKQERRRLADLEAEGVIWGDFRAKRKRAFIFKQYTLRNRVIIARQKAGRYT